MNLLIKCIDSWMNELIIYGYIYTKNGWMEGWLYYVYEEIELSFLFGVMIFIRSFINIQGY